MKPVLTAMSAEIKMFTDINGAENYSFEKPSLIVANHRSMKDIFTLSAMLPEATKIVLSSRLMWRQSDAFQRFRHRLIQDTLYGIPLETHSKERLAAGLDMAQQALGDGWSVIIFPEGAYTGESVVHRGRTGAARILFNARDQGIDAQLLPVGIKQHGELIEKSTPDTFLPFIDMSTISVGTPLDYEEDYSNYKNAIDDEQRGIILRKLIDSCMKSIATLADQPCVDDYIPITPRNTMILESGQEVAINPKA